VALHCRTVQDDPGFCSSGEGREQPRSVGQPRPRPTPVATAFRRLQDSVSVPDRRIRAIVALAPMAMVVHAREPGRSHDPGTRHLGRDWMLCSTASTTASHVVANLPAVQASTATAAGHFAFMAQAAFPLPSAAGDAAANPPGFDRLAFLPELENQVAGFFAEQWR
jgi:hypothetical protein